MSTNPLQPRSSRLTPTGEALMLTAPTVRPLLQDIPLDAHKGTQGHALLMAGSYGMAGAALMASESALRSGLGKLTCHTAALNLPLVQTTVPEAIVHPDADLHHLTQLPPLQPYQAIGIGPGIGTHPDTAQLLEQLLKAVRQPLILDADALNILGQQSHLQTLLPPDTIITPHPKELQNFTGPLRDDPSRQAAAATLAQEHHLIVVLKGPHTHIYTPDGRVFINTTGNPGMATAGSGDVLTGLILGLLARGHQPLQATCLGVYLHGLSGDLAAHDLGPDSLIARDLITHLPKAFQQLRKQPLTP